MNFLFGSHINILTLFKLGYSGKIWAGRGHIVPLPLFFLYLWSNGPYSSFLIFCLKTRLWGIMAAFC